MRRASAGGVSPLAAQRYYRALALARMGQAEKASPLFQELVEQATQALGSSAKLDPGSSFEVQQGVRSSMATAHYIAGLGYLGRKESAKAKAAFAKALEWSPDHLGARIASLEAAR
jgi:tetratricopeptide (TPR) repeat protein